MKNGSSMTLEQAIELVRKAVKFTGSIDQKHIDLTLVPAEERPTYEKALARLALEVSKGTLTKDVLNSRLHLDH